MELRVTTKRKITNFTFYWSISQFDTICPKKCTDFEHYLKSESFTVGGDGEMKSKWNVYIYGETGYIGCYLKLCSSTNADGTKNSENVTCNFTFILGNDHEEFIRRNGGEHDFSTGSKWGSKALLSIEKLYATELFLRHSTLQICVQMQIFGEFFKPSSTLLPPKVKENVDNSQILCADFEELLNNKKYADVQIACGTETFYAHKLIMCVRSKVFGAMFESKMEEVATSKIVLTVIDSSTFRAILLYIYTGKVSDATSHTELIYGAEKYDLMGLKQHCFDELYKNVTDETIGTLAVAAEMYNADEQTKIYFI